MSEDNVFLLPGVVRPADPSNPKPLPGLVKLLEQTLELAKSGKLQSFIGTGFTANGERMAMWCNTHPDVYQMLGSINWLEHEYIYRTTKNNPDAIR